MKLKIQYAVVSKDEHGQNIQIFDTEKHAQEFVNAMKDINLAKIKGITLNLGK